MPRKIYKKPGQEKEDRRRKDYWQKRRKEEAEAKAAREREQFERLIDQTQSTHPTEPTSEV